MIAESVPVKFKPYTRQTINQARQWEWLPEDLREAVQVVSHVLPFRTNSYVLDHLIDWDKVPDDPIYRLVFPHRDMLPPGEYGHLRDLVLVRRDAAAIAHYAHGIRMRMNPHPAGQMTHNVPRVNDAPLQGLQHKYRYWYNASLMKAYSYSRFSSDAQRQGTSIERQQSLARRWCEDNNVDLSSEAFADEAVSGFHGDNLATGSLARFIRHVEAGDIERGSYLILENLDRLSRQNAWEASGLLQRLVKLGITVITLRPSEMRFDQNSSALDLLQAILHMDNAHRESVRKSDLGKLEWGKRFARAREHKHHIGKRVSNWLTLGDDGVYRLNEKASTVQKIFELCLEGHGSTVIAQKLNANDCETFNKGKRWGTTAVLTILQNRAAIGEFAPKDGGDPIPNYFESVVDKDTFDAAQATIRARKTGKVTKQAADFNVWSKLVFCGACGSSMHIIRRTSFRYLMCANRRYGTCEGSKNVRLDESEDIFMAVLLEMDAMGLVKPDPDKTARDLATVEGRLIAERNALAIWTGKLALHPESETFHNFVLQSEGRINAMKREIERLTAELTGGERINWAEFKAKIDLTDRSTRMRANAYLRRLGVQVLIAEGYLVTQQKDAKAMFVVAKGKFGAISLDADGDREKEQTPDAQAAHAIALNVKNLLLEPDGGLVYRGMLTVPNGRGTRRPKVTPANL